MTKELAKTIFTDVIQTFGYINNPTKVDACYVLRNGNFLDTQGNFPTHQHINIAKYISETYKINDLNTMNNGSNFMMNICGAIKITCWNGGKGIKGIYLPKHELTSEQYDALELFIAFVGKNVTEDWPLWVATYDEGQQIEYTKPFKLAERVIADIEYFYYSGKLELTEELIENNESITEATENAGKTDPFATAWLNYIFKHYNEFISLIDNPDNFDSFYTTAYTKYPELKNDERVKASFNNWIQRFKSDNWLPPVYSKWENLSHFKSLSKENLSQLNLIQEWFDGTGIYIIAHIPTKRIYIGQANRVHGRQWYDRGFISRMHEHATSRGVEGDADSRWHKFLTISDTSEYICAILKVTEDTHTFEKQLIGTSTDYELPLGNIFDLNVREGGTGGSSLRKNIADVTERVKDLLINGNNGKHLSGTQIADIINKEFNFDKTKPYSNKDVSRIAKENGWRTTDAARQAMKDQQRAKYAIKDVSCYSFDDKKIRDFDDTTKAAEWVKKANTKLGTMETVIKQIKRAVQGKIPSAYGYIWKTNNKNESLLEDNRNLLVSKSRNAGEYEHQERGKNRFERKKYSQIAKTVKQYNQIDMNKFFKEDQLIVHIPVVGETDSYTVSIKMDGVVAEIAKNIKNNKNRLEYRTIIQALTKVFNTANIFVKCTCDDYKYRFAHWNIINNVSVDDTASDPGPGKGIRNPNDDKGRGCKHVLLVLANGDWLLKVASVINNYIHYAEEHLQKAFLKLIFPKLYGYPADEMVEQDIIDDDKYLESSTGLIDAINEYGKNRGKYKPGSNKNPVTGTGGKTKKEDPKTEEPEEIESENK